MAVPPISPAKKEVAAASRKAGAKRKRQPSSAPSQAPVAGAAGVAPLPAPKRNKSPGVRVVGGRIYDSDHGKTCHQCRQKTMDFSAACNNERRGKPCLIRFCHKCLLNRYGEKAEEMAAREDWSCPKCRGICNCSLCMKKKGERPTGILIHAAKATGYSSVSEMLQLYHMRSGAEEMEKGAADSVSNKLPSSGKLVALEKKQGKDNSHAASRVLELAGQVSKSGKERRETEDVKVEGKSKVSKLKMKNSNDMACDLTKERENFVGKNVSEEDLGRREKEGEVINDEKLEIVDARTKGKSKVSKIKRENSNGVACNLTKGNSKQKENFVAKKTMKADLGRCKKKDGMTDEREMASTDYNGKKVPMFEIKTGCNGEVQVCDGSNIVEQKGDLYKHNSKGIKNSMMKKQMDIRKAFSDGIEKDVLNKKSSSAKPELLLRVCRESKHATVSVSDSPVPVVVMPEGTRLTTVAGVKLEVEDVGPALQFLEFCSAFGKVLDIPKGHPESVLRELAHGRGVRRGLNSLIVQFYIKLLSRIQKDDGDRSLLCAANDGTWLTALKKCIIESQCALEDLPMDWLNKGAAGYAYLDSSKKLRLLNFLCDELLGTEEMRSWIDEENVEFIAKRREAREKVLVVKEEEKRLKKRLKDEVAQAMLQLRNGAPLTISEHKDLVSKIKTQTEKAHSEVLGSLDVLCKKKQRSDAVRTDPILLEGDGLAYWRLKGYDSSRIVLQDIGNWGLIGPQDKWFGYDDQQEKMVEKHLHSSRNQKLVRRKILKSRILHSCKDYAQDELPKNIAQLPMNNT